MKFDIYLASSWYNRENARRAMNIIEAHGHRITHDWTATLPGKSSTELREQSIEDVEGVAKAQVYVMLWPGRLGSATELGIALATKKYIFIVGDVPKDDYVFANHPRVQVIPTIVSLLKYLEALGKIKTLQQIEEYFAEAAMREEGSCLRCGNGSTEIGSTD